MSFDCFWRGGLLLVSARSTREIEKSVKFKRVSVSQFAGHRELSEAFSINTNGRVTWDEWSSGVWGRGEDEHYGVFTNNCHDHVHMILGLLQ